MTKPRRSETEKSLMAGNDNFEGREAISAANDNCQLFTPKQAAEKLGCSVKTLTRHIRAGTLSYVAIGLGTKYPRRMFAATDLEAFIERRRRGTTWGSSGDQPANSTITPSSTKVFAIVDRRKKPPSGKPSR